MLRCEHSARVVSDARSDPDAAIPPSQPACRYYLLRVAIPSYPLTLTLALWAALAALAAGWGPVLLGTPPAPQPRHLGFASALAAGAMLGVGYALMSLGLDRSGGAATVGAMLGVAATYASHLWLGVGAAPRTVRARHAVGAGALHAAPEGIAMGAAMAADHRFGLFLIATLAVHNVWEGEVLGTQILAGGGMPAPQRPGTSPRCSRAARCCCTWPRAPARWPR